MPETFKEILTDRGLEASIYVIRAAFMTVAEEFNLTPENAPTHAAFLQLDDLKKMRDRGVAMFGLFEGEVQAGFVAVERADGGEYYMEKLAVLPAHRHRGRGRAMIAFVCEYVKRNGGSRVSVGIVDDHKVLKDWYQTCGFNVTGSREFKHLPFRVCFLARSL